MEGIQAAVEAVDGLFDVPRNRNGVRLGAAHLAAIQPDDTFGVRGAE